MLERNGGWTDSKEIWPIHPQEADLEKKLVSRIAEVMADKNLYDAAKLAALSDLYFINAAMKTLTDLTLDMFVNDVLSGITPTFVMDVTQVTLNKNEKFPTYKYKVTAMVRLPKGDWNPLSDYVFLSFYTNRNDIPRISKGAKISVTGKIVGLEPELVGDGTNIVMTDQ